jgi:hypothetical protein
MSSAVVERRRVIFDPCGAGRFRECRRIRRSRQQSGSAEHATRGIEGYRGAHLLRRQLAGEVASATVLLFDTLDAARVIAGKDYEAADVPLRLPRAVLSRFDDRSAHYEVRLTPMSESAP